ncbi:serine/arginine repetitive matrix protein 1 isoform X2 [Drosophila kikkawai]|uniref:Serine/arginine repetitive matrix protein 1 isoform X2 n=1 Tax=Drosophila kikkawai TaxID=30033 RepID=A0ABM3C5F0_DROKI|nr:serine/arginine repetitive matrix protein 1 isoform X2 [Drosophila kikkawai]
MESKNRPILGGSIVLERQERFSIQTSERIYLQGRRVYRNPSVIAARTTSSSDEIEKIHRTRERVESLNHQINHEIDRLKEVNNSFKKRKEERRMTWAERFKANRPIVRQQGGGGRCACPDGFPKPASQEVKRIDVTPIKPPPKGVSLKEFPKEIKSKELYQRKLPPKELPPRKLPPKELPPKELPPRQLPLKELPPKKPQPRQLPAKELIGRKPMPRVFVSKGLPLKELNPRKPPIKVILPKDLPPKRIAPKGLPPKELTPQKPLPKRIPLKDLPSKEPPLKPGKPPANSSIQKELKPGKPPPKDLKTENPKPKEEPRQSELRCKELTARLSGGCCNCCCHYPTSYGAPDCCYNIAFNRGIEHGIPYCTARRRVTDLNTQEICGNRCVSVSPDRRTVGQQRSSKLTVSPSSFLESPREKRKSPIRSGKILTNENNRQKNKMRNQEKLPKVESQEKKSRDQGSLRIVESRENIKQGKVPSPEIPWKNEFQYPENLKQETEVVPPKSQSRKEDERMYQEYLRLYYQENSKEDLREGVKPIPTYTKLRKENVKPTDRRECPENQINSWEGQRVSVCRDSQKVKTPILDQCNHERRGYHDPGCSIEMFPAPFTYESCFDEWGSTPLDSNTTDPVSDSPSPSPSPTPTPTPTPTPSPTPTPAPTPPPTNCKETRFHYPSGSGATGADIQYTNCPDKDRKGLRQERIKERVVAPKVSKNQGLRQERSKITKEIVEDSKHQGLRQERAKSTKETVVAKNIYQDPSSLPRDLETDSVSYASLPVKHQIVSPPTRQANTTTETQRRPERSSLTYPTRSSQNSNQVFNGRHSNLSSKAESSRKPQSPSTDSHRQSNPHPFSHVEGLSRNQESPTVDTHRQSKPSSFSLVEGLSRNQASPTTHSHRRSNPSPISFGGESPTSVSTETIANNSHYQTKDLQVSNEDQKFDMNLLESRLKKELKNSTENKELKDASSMLSGGTSTQESFRKPLSKGFKNSQDFEINDEENTEKTFHRKREVSSFRQFLSEARNQDQDDENEFSKFLKRKNEYSEVQNQDQEDANEYSSFLNRKTHYSQAQNQDEEEEEDTKFLNRKKDYSNRSDDIQSGCECDGYETARSMASSKHHHLLSAMSSSRNKSYATVCDKRTRTVTFKDEDGVLNKRSHVEEQCRNHIDWEQALKYRQPDSILSNDNYTPRSSSSAEHTCLESSWEEEEEDAYDSCLETLSPRDEEKPSFNACPCMYETYRQLAALCQSKSPYYR